MKHIFLVAMLVAPVPALADGYVMGAGRWDCAKVIEVFDGEPDADYFQMAGWILGFWSRESLDRDAAFNDKLESIGGKQVFEFTANACRKVEPATKLYALTRKVIESSR